MSKPKKSVPKAVKEFYDRHDKLQLLLDNTEIVHSEAFHEGLSVLKDGKGIANYKLLDDEKIQDKFLKKIMDHYITKAVQSMGLKSKPKDAMDEDIMLKRYIGVTRGQLRQQLRDLKSDYNIKHHEKNRDDLISRQRQELSPLKHTHIEQSDIGTILKHLKVGDYVSEDVGVQRVAGLLDVYRANGEINIGTLANIANTSTEKGGWGNDIYLTTKAKKAIEGLKDQYKKPQ